MLDTINSRNAALGVTDISGVLQDRSIDEGMPPLPFHVRFKIIVALSIISWLAVGLAGYLLVVAFEIFVLSWH